MQSLRGALAALLIAVATALVVVAVAILPFLSPPWVGFAQDQAQAGAWTGFEPADLRAVTDVILADLVIGPPAFDVTLAGQPVLTQRERDHMRDVRAVFAGFYLAAAIGALVLVGAFAVGRGRARATLWRRISRSGLVIAVVTVAGGLTAMMSFDTAFTVFHEVFFPQGNWQFDPATDRLVQLFPESFWVDSTVGVGVVVIVLSLLLALVGARRAAAMEARMLGTPATLSAVPVR